MAITFTPLISYTLTNTPSTVTITGIPQGYTDLFLSVSGVGVTGGGSVQWQANGDTNANSYNFAFMWNNASSTNAANAVNSTVGQAGRINFDAGNQNGGGPTVFLNYSSSSYYKYSISRTAQSNITLNAVSVWKNTNAITSLTFRIESGSLFQTGFRFDLYGILKA